MDVMSNLNAKKVLQTPIGIAFPICGSQIVMQTPIDGDVGTPSL